jgi:hypothetical protein
MILEAFLPLARHRSGGAPPLAAALVFFSLLAGGGALAQDHAPAKTLAFTIERVKTFMPPGAKPEDAVIERREASRAEVVALVRRYHPSAQKPGPDGEAPAPPADLPDAELLVAIAEYNKVLGGAAMRRIVPETYTRIVVREVAKPPVQP